MTPGDDASIPQSRLAIMRKHFVKTWAAGGVRRRVDFEIELDRLIYAVFAVAQEPFIKELGMHRDLFTQKDRLAPKSIILPKETAP